MLKSCHSCYSSNLAISASQTVCLTLLLLLFLQQWTAACQWDKRQWSHRLPRVGRQQVPVWTSGDSWWGATSTRCSCRCVRNVGLVRHRLWWGALRPSDTLPASVSVLSAPSSTPSRPYTTRPNSDNKLLCIEPTKRRKTTRVWLLTNALNSSTCATAFLYVVCLVPCLLTTRWKPWTDAIMMVQLVLLIYCLRLLLTWGINLVYVWHVYQRRVFA